MNYNTAAMAQQGQVISGARAISSVNPQTEDSEIVRELRRLNSGNVDLSALVSTLWERLNGVTLPAAPASAQEKTVDTVVNSPLGGSLRSESLRIESTIQSLQGLLQSLCI